MNKPNKFNKAKILCTGLKTCKCFQVYFPNTPDHSRMLTNAFECFRMRLNAFRMHFGDFRKLTNAHECSRMLSNAHERPRTPTNAHDRSWRSRMIPTGHDRSEIGLPNGQNSTIIFNQMFLWTKSEIIDFLIFWSNF